ncbi:MAG: hypothetical protein L0H38_02500, partial [bacterium]|nr:hypothetical protein [bacterium]
MAALSVALIVTLFIFATNSADAKLDTSTGKATVDQSTFRAYNSSTTTAPGSPLAATDQSATLLDTGDEFRLRAGITNTDEPYVPLTIKQVAVTSYYSCALASNDWAYCWGENSDGRLGTGRSSSYISAPTQVSRGDIPSGQTIKSIAAASNGAYVCAVASDNWVYCWGENGSSQLGDNTTTNRNQPTAIARGAIPTGVSIKSISLGNEHACVIASNDKAYCWGSNSEGQLGDDSTTNRPTPVAVKNGSMPTPYTVKSISTGGLSTCAIHTNNKAYCWGGNWDGRLATGDNTSTGTPVAMARGAMPSNFTIKDISVGEFSVCVVANNDRGYCAGYNTGQLGSTPTSGTNTMRAIAQGAMPSLTIKKISLAANHACAIHTNNKAYCWGSNDFGQLGDNSTTRSAVPVALSQGELPSGQAVSSILPSYSHTCAVASGDGLAYCWGYNYDGRLGNGYYDHQNAPARVLMGAMSDGITASSVSYGDSIGCVVADDDWVYCWGWNVNGRLGDGTTTSRLKPTRVLNGDIAAGLTISSVDLGSRHACALTSDSWAYCWGRGGVGQLGNHDEVTYMSPSRIVRGAMPPGATIKAVSAGGVNSCMIASDDWLYCVGDNAYGYRGVGYTGGGNSQPEKVVRGAIPSGATIKQVSVGGEESCAIASDDWLYCWGKNTYGGLGDNSTTTRSSPVKLSRGAISSGVTIKAVSVGEEHACAIASDDWLYCWGYNSSSQLGDNTAINRSTPVKVSRGDIPTGVTIKSLSLGEAHSCAVASNGKSYCWGLNNLNQIGWDSSGSTAVPRLQVRGDLPEAATVSSISAGAQNTCAIASDRRVYCVGWNDDSGELGNGSQEISSVLAKVDHGDYNPDHTIQSGALSLKLQYVEKPDATACAAISSGWADITNSSPIAFGSSPPANGSAISSSLNDPVAPTAGGFKYQSIVQSGTSFSNPSSIEPQSTGLWDFALADKSNKSDTSYCLRMATTNGTSSIDTYGAYPEITTALGTLDVQFVDNSGNPIVGSGTDVSFPTQLTKSAVQTSESKLVDVSSKQLNVSNSLSDNGWSVSLAASGSQWSAG